jgi:hypothetical protein
MNNNCEKNTPAHSQNILHLDALYNIKRKKHKNVPFDRMVMICFIELVMFSLFAM